jgi:hypothetical protein
MSFRRFFSASCTARTTGGAASCPPDPGARLAAGRAHLRDHLVLGHRRRRRRGCLEHLPLLHVGDGSISQVRAAGGARLRYAFHRLTGVIGSPERCGRRTRLLARLAPGAPPQRPVPRLLPIPAIRRRRLRRRGESWPRRRRNSSICSARFACAASSCESLAASCAAVTSSRQLRGPVRHLGGPVPGCIRSVAFGCGVPGGRTHGRGVCP